MQLTTVAANTGLGFCEVLGVSPDFFVFLIVFWVMDYFASLHALTSFREGSGWLCWKRGFTSRKMQYFLLSEQVRTICSLCELRVNLLLFFLFIAESGSRGDRKKR